MKHRKLRIAWSVACGVLALLLIALWVRSYLQLDILKPIGHEVWIARGRIIIDETYVPSSAPQAVPREIQPTSNGVFISSGTIQTLKATGTGIKVPIGVPTFVCILLGTLPWFAERFSLRTLLIAMSLIALMLGLVVWAAK